MHAYVDTDTWSSSINWRRKEKLSFLICFGGTYTLCDSVFFFSFLFIAIFENADFFLLTISWSYTFGEIIFAFLLLLNAQTCAINHLYSLRWHRMTVFFSSLSFTYPILVTATDYNIMYARSLAFPHVPISFSITIQRPTLNGERERERKNHTSKDKSIILHTIHLTFQFTCPGHTCRALFISISLSFSNKFDVSCQFLIHNRWKAHTNTHNVWKSQSTRRQQHNNG